MLRSLTILVTFSLILAAGTPAFGQKSSTAKPLTARYIVQVTFDDEYRSSTDKPNEVDKARPHDTEKTESRVHLQIEASRWLKIQPGDGGSTEFVSLDGSQSSGSAAVTASATSEARTDNGTGDKNRVISVDTKSANFSGKAAVSNVITDDSPLFVQLPQFSELGNGLEFRIKVKATLTGSCEGKSISDSGTRTTHDCDSASPILAEGFEVKGENSNKGNANGAGWLSQFETDMTIYPPLSGEQAKMQSSEEREKVSGVWIGAETRGDRQAGYKSTFAASKTIINESADGTDRKEIQKIEFMGQIVPGIPTAAGGVTASIMGSDLLLAEEPRREADLTR